MGNCLAGETCIFSHDPSYLVGKLTLDRARTPPVRAATFSLQDHESFPALGSVRPSTPDMHPTLSLTPPLSGLRPGFDAVLSRARPGSRHAALVPKDTAAPSLDDPVAFPQLGAAAKQAKKHHGKRGAHHGAHDYSTVVAATPSHARDLRPDSRPMHRHGSWSNLRADHSANTTVPPPKNLPWLEAGEKTNKAYIKARTEALRHYGMRNRFLQK